MPILGNLYVDLFCGRDRYFGERFNETSMLITSFVPVANDIRGSSLCMFATVGVINSGDGYAVKFVVRKNSFVSTIYLTP